MAVTSTASKGFNPFSLDAVNFLLSDVRGALGPMLRRPLPATASCSNPGRWSSSAAAWGGLSTKGNHGRPRDRKAPSDHRRFGIGGETPLHTVEPAVLLNAAPGVFVGA
jgi:hypothetical protein